MNGAELTVESSGEDISLGADGASVVRGNVQTANTTAYTIDGVLIPPSE